ncbi:MAG TPA: response regulator transcription factor, partial [Steroidobacteraceae bacterium]|nr:response regulator transcription factor [Steroidobacteraceae bacterium]
MSDGHLLLGRRPRVVLIDDHRMFAQALGESLTARYDLVATAYRADEFLTLVQSTQADVALLDLQLPDRCGLDVIGDALRIQPALRILIVTMYRDRLLADTAIAAGAAGLIPKDAKTEELYYAIDQVLAGAQYLSPLLPKISHSVATEARHLAYRHLTRRQQQV